MLRGAAVDFRVEIAHVETNESILFDDDESMYMR